MTEIEFKQKYCSHCGTPRCEGIRTEWFEGCQYKWNLNDYGDAAAEIEKLNDKIMELGYKLIKIINVEPVQHGEWKSVLVKLGSASNVYVGREQCSECGSLETEQRNYCPNCGAKMDRKGNKNDNC